MTKTYQSHSGYFSRAFGSIEAIGCKMHEKLKGVEYDTIVGTGLSGTLVVPTLGRAFEKYWAIIRKEHSPHTNALIEGEIGQRWVFVDDFISSGRTVERVKEVLSEIQIWDPQNYQYLPFPTTYVGTYMYERNLYVAA